MCSAPDDEEGEGGPGTMETTEWEIDILSIAAERRSCVM